MGYLIAIDPSINDMGCAIFKNKKLISGELLKPRKLGEKSKDHILKSRALLSAIKERRRLLKSKKVDIILEIPEYHGVAGYLARESGSIFKLTFLCGMICSMKDVITYTPSGWKGQLSKEVTQNRLAKYYPKKNIKELNHNIVDAIGIGHKHIFGRV